jgi:hypothetical protein
MQERSRLSRRCGHVFGRSVARPAKVRHTFNSLFIAISDCVHRVNAVCRSARQTCAPHARRCSRPSPRGTLFFATTPEVRQVHHMTDNSRCTRRRLRSEERPEGSAWRRRWHEVIFEADTPAGKRFDVALLVLILISVLAVSLESVAALRADFGPVLRATEWVITGLFSVEYLARLVSVRRPLRYVASFYGVSIFWPFCRPI